MYCSGIQTFFGKNMNTVFFTINYSQLVFLNVDAYKLKFKEVVSE